MRNKQQSNGDPQPKGPFVFVDSDGCPARRRAKRESQGITALMKESYSRTYVHLVMVQQLSELEEVVEFKNVLRDMSVSSTARQGGAAGGCGHIRDAPRRPRAV